MPEQRQWQLLPAHLQSDMRFQMALLVAHRRIYDRWFAEEPSVNPHLGFHLRGYRRSANWRILLMLTPWMLSRLLFPEQAPDIAIPPGWSAQEQHGADYQWLGPVVHLDWDDGELKAHLNYQESLGHYLLQPLALDMLPYASHREAFAAWDPASKSRDESLPRWERDRSWQREISRCDFPHRLGVDRTPSSD